MMMMRMMMMTLSVWSGCCGTKPWCRRLGSASSSGSLVMIMIMNVMSFLVMKVILKLKFTEYYTYWLWHGWNRTGGRGGNGEGILQKGFPPPPSSLSVSSGLSIIGMLFFFHIRFSIMTFLLWYLLPSCASYQWRPPPWCACWRRSARPPTQQLEGKGSETCKAQWGQGWDNDHGFLDAGREW